MNKLPKMESDARQSIRRLAGVMMLAGVLGQCPALAHLHIHGNGIEAVGKGRLQATWRGQASGLIL